MHSVADLQKIVQWYTYMRIVRVCVRAYFVNYFFLDVVLS